MSYSWYRTDSAYHRHPKMLALKAELKEPMADAYVSRLWSWTQVYAPSGTFSAALIDGLESELGWTGSRGSLAAALEKTGWLDREGSDVFVHDWPDLQGFHVKKARKDADKKRKRRHRASARTERGQNALSATVVVRTAPPTDGRDGRNETDATNETNGTLPGVPLASADELEQQVFEHWRTVMGKTAAALFTKERRAKVRARLAEGRSVADLKLAIDGCSKTPHNIGQNDTGERWDDLELICRNGANVERFMGNARTPPKPATSPPAIRREEPTTPRPEGRVELPR